MNQTTKPLTSHTHTRRGSTNHVWGSREDCKECMAKDARIAEVRKEFQADREAEVEWQDGTRSEIDRGIIGADVKPINKLAGQLAIYTAIIFVCGMIVGAILLAAQDAAMIAGGN